MIDDPTWHDRDIECLFLLLRACILGLNRLASCRMPDDQRGRSAPQRCAQTTLLHKCSRFCRRLASQDFTEDRAHLLAELISDTEALGVPKTRPLVASTFDLLDLSAQVDPLPDVPEEYTLYFLMGIGCFHP